MPKSDPNNKVIFYVTRDIERALGVEPGPQNIIITNRTPYAEIIQAVHPKYVHLIGNGHEIHDTFSLLNLFEPENILSQEKSNKDFVIIVFYNSVRIEELARKKGWTLINPPVNLAEKIENKITQIEWLGDWGHEFLPEYKITLVKDLLWENKKFVLQWSHGHTGDGTEIIDSGSKLNILKEKFPNRQCRVSEYITGPTFTVNIVVAGNNIMTGNISYQITGIQPFTDNMFSTIGNDWGVVGSLLSEEEIEYIRTIAKTIGNKMSSDGWRGLFGIDVIKDDNKNKIFLLEINARQPASTTFESLLQKRFKENGAQGDITIFEAHTRSLLGDSIQEKLITINDGAQIVQRVTKDKKFVSEDVVGAVQLLGCKTIQYPNLEPNSDMLRIQCSKNIMSGHNKFNKNGQDISDILNGKLA